MKRMKSNFRNIEYFLTKKFERNAFSFNTAKFDIGSLNSSSFLSGQLQEVIIYNRALSSTEIANVKGYLNLKYKIY